METIIKGYRGDAALRGSFNALAKATFGLDFEPWYQNGFWGENYNPYSLVLDGRVAANVSVNRTDMRIGGRLRKLYQLGTVMTAQEYRGRGYIRRIMAEIERDIADAEGVYLFANDGVLGFYPKFGFARGAEFVYEREVLGGGACSMQRVPMDSPEAYARLKSAMEQNRFETACRMEGNPGLIFFYASQFMKDCVYYDKALDTWAIAEIEDGEMTLHEVFSSKEISLNDVVAAFGGGISKVTLGFAPADASGFACRELHEEDCTFFVRGDAFEDFGKRRLRIPSLGHA